MPLYEYYCTPCDGIFETLRPIREASDPVPCPVCDKDGMRIMPTSITAFTFREGYARSLPDKGTYWHLGKEVKKRVTGGMKPFEHPEINKARPAARKSKGDLAIEKEKITLRKKELKRMADSGIHPTETRLPKKLRE